MINIKINKKNIGKAKEIIKNGGVIIYPTDTLYGLGTDIFNEKAIKRVFKIKKRDFKKPISVMVSEHKDIKKIAFISDKQDKIIKKLLPGPYTVILKKKKIISDLLTAGSDKVGIRIPKDKFCQILSKDLPITATSANISGEKNFDYKKLKGINLFLKGGRPSGRPSEIVDLTGKIFKIKKRE